jgi:hypothetical protein
VLENRAPLSKKYVYLNRGYEPVYEFPEGLSAGQSASTFDRKNYVMRQVEAVLQRSGYTTTRTYSQSNRNETGFITATNSHGDHFPVHVLVSTRAAGTFTVRGHAPTGPNLVALVTLGEDTNLKSLYLFHFNSPIPDTAPKRSGVRQ